MNLELHVLDLGTKSYEETAKLHKQLADQRQADKIPDTLLIAQHPPTITLGLSEKRNTIHATPRELHDYGIKLHQSQRAGGAAYLGPGQLTFYPAIKLQQHGISGYDYIREIEKVTHKAAQALGANTYLGSVPNPNTGKAYKSVWYNAHGKPHKFFAIGIHTTGGMFGTIDNGGFTLLVEPEGHQYYHLIDHCGFQLDQVGATSIAEMLGTPADYADIKSTMVEQLGKHFNYNVMHKQLSEVAPHA